ncbi:MAG: M20/M25/M40 family metallo-hydrolase [Candidatus Eisenbacteria bacterium]|nr:M20/M25/M40 family metallo-hydrolase [Candidatus Eisenbacteria bacterium]
MSRDTGPDVRGEEVSMLHAKRALAIACVTVLLAAFLAGAVAPASASAPDRMVVPNPAFQPSPWTRLVALPAADAAWGRGARGACWIPIRQVGDWLVVGLEPGCEPPEMLESAVPLPVPEESGEALVAILNDARAPQVPAAERRARLSALGETVQLDGTVALLLTDAAGVNAAASWGTIVQVFMRPGAAAPNAKRLPLELPEIVYQPWIQARADDVDTDTLMAVVQRLQDLGTRRSDLSGAREAEAILHEKLRSYGYDDVWLMDYNTWSDNVVARKTGTVLPDEVIVVGGHYDSISRDGAAPGADDNATGTAATLEAARLLAEGDFQRTIIFCGFSGEEQGLVGSEAFAAWAADQGMNIVAMINMDMLGYRASGDAIDLDLISRDMAQELVDYVQSAAPLYVPELPVVEGHLSGGDSDHSSFLRHGYQAVFFFEDSDRYSPYIHTAQDRIGISLNDEAFFTLCVRAAVATVASLAEPFTIDIAHDALDADQDPLQPYPVTARISSPQGGAVSSAGIAYRVGGGAWRTRALTPRGTGDRYEGSIPGQRRGAIVRYYLRAEDVHGRVARHPLGAAEAHLFRVGYEEILADDFDQDRGWIGEAAGDDAESGRWIRAEPVGTLYQPEEDRTPGPGGKCWVTGNGRPGDEEGAADVDGGRTTLLSPLFDAEHMQRIEISYWLWYRNDVRPDDRFRVDLSSDGGLSWIPLHEVSGSLPGWTEVTHTDVDRRVVPTDAMRLRFTASDEGLASIVEAALDDVVIRAIPIDFPGIPDEPLPFLTALKSLEVWPNPSAGLATIRFSIPDPRRVTLQLHSVTGRRLATLLDGSVASGEHTVMLNSRAGTRSLPAGIYWLRLDDGGRTLTRRLVVLH